jgi:hypothetical protein
MPLQELKNITLHPPMADEVIRAGENNFEQNGVHLGCLWE